MSERVRRFRFGIRRGDGLYYAGRDRNGVCCWTDVPILKLPNVAAAERRREGLSDDCQVVAVER